jgi:Tol biopolymer transport system component
MPFMDVRQVPGINNEDMNEGASLSPDELTIYFASNRQSPGSADGDIYVATRASRDEPFGAAVSLPTVNTGSDERHPSISPDGLTLFFHSSRGGNYDLYASTRANAAAPFGSPVALPAAINTMDIETGPITTSTGKTLYFERTLASGQVEIWTSSLGAAGFGAPAPVSELDSGNDAAPTPSGDGLTMYFTSWRAGGAGKGDAWVATRASTAASFGPATNLTSINTDKDEYVSWISPDDCRLYFWSERGGGNYELWQATRP